MERPNKKLYEELIDKSALVAADKSKNSYIFTGNKFLKINFDSMSTREAINYLTALFNIIASVDADHQWDFELDPIVDYMLKLSYKVYQNARNNSEKWSEVSPAQKNISRQCIDPFFEKLGMVDNPNSIEFSARIAKSKQNLQASFDNNDRDLIDAAKLPDFAKQFEEKNKQYNIMFPNVK